MGGLSRASLWGEAGSRERERGEFREVQGVASPRLSGLGASGAGELRRWWAGLSLRA